MKKLRKSMAALLIILLLSGCATKTEKESQLPEVSFPVPERPVLLALEDSASPEATENLIALTAYSEGLLETVRAWESYYQSLRELYTE